MPVLHFLLLGSAAIAAGEEIACLPRSATLDGPRASQRFVVEGVRDGAFVGDRSGEATFAVSNPNIAIVSDDGVVTPVSDGVATLTASVGNRSASALITVRGSRRRDPPSFRGDVLPVLTKAGCNQGSCHGAAAGKRGFRLTLRGYAPEIDYDMLTRQAKGRRILPAAPHESLMLLKATGALEHGGGARFGADSAEYRTIARWIAAGMPPPTEADARTVRIETLPGAVILRPGDRQQLIVLAVDSDGRVRDVTRWARFGTADETVATVDEGGVLSVVGEGEGAITVRFDSLVDLAAVTVPYDRALPEGVIAGAPRHNPIDELNLEKLAALNIPPSPTCDDATFLRRASLDATGTLPSAAEVEAFLADDDPEKRIALIDRLLESEEYVDYWAYKWSDLFLVSSRDLPSPAMWTFYRFLRDNVAANTPWDEFARRVVTASGSTLEDGAANYFVIHRDPIELAENASKAFLGLSLTCARCHNHPLEKWTQDEYYGFANLFGRVRLKDGDGAPGDVLVIPADSGEVIHPRRGVAMAPRPLDAEPATRDSAADRRTIFADWLAEVDNPYFAAALVNRVWANFFGRGLVDPEDDLRATNPPSDPALMDWLAADFIAHGYDVKRLIRTIMTSAAYQRSSAPLPGNAGDSKFLSHASPRRLPAEVMHDAIAEVTGVPSRFDGYPAGWRSLQLPDVGVASAFLDTFGRPERNDTCSCERSAEPSLAQALHLANGATLDQKLGDDDGRVAHDAASDAPFEAIVDRLFKAALGRPPSAAERARLLPALDDAVDDAGTDDEHAAARRRAIEDLYWAVLTSNEFLFNH